MRRVGELALGSEAPFPRQVEEPHLADRRPLVGRVAVGAAAAPMGDRDGGLAAGFDRSSQSEYAKTKMTKMILFQYHGSTAPPETH